MNSSTRGKCSIPVCEKCGRLLHYGERVWRRDNKAFRNSGKRYICKPCHDAIKEQRKKERKKEQYFGRPYFPLYSMEK